jgi:23S rRNA (uracil747-C5)-methyltransferase
MLYTPAMQALLGHLERFIQIAGLPTYRIDKQKGELKFIHVLQNSRDEFMVRFVLRSTKVLAQLKSYLPLLYEAYPNVRVVTANILPEHKAVLQGEQEFYLTQERALIEHINGVPLYMSAQGFFQTNIDVTASLYATAQAWTDKLKVPYIWDLFCGVGGFGLSIAKTSSQLVGIEINQEAIAYAKKSAQALSLSDVNFMALPSEEFALSIDEVPDLVVVNPPRKGVGTLLSKRIQAMNVAYILYSSCNVHTLREDLEALDNYRISKIKLFDMFAHTMHYEVLVLLEQKTQTIDTPERVFER